MVTLTVVMAHVLLAIRLITHDMRTTYIINGKTVTGAASTVGVLCCAVDISVAQRCRGG